MHLAVLASLLLSRLNHLAALLHMQKLFHAITLVLAAILLASCYGVLHDQLTYSLSPEYYTKFKFYQFGLYDYFDHSPRLGVTIVGIAATWWVGLVAGIGLAVPAQFQEKGARVCTSAWALAICIIVPLLLTPVLVIGTRAEEYLSGISYTFYQVTLPPFVPEHLQVLDQAAFVLVGDIHNISYMSGVAGVGLAIVYLVWKAVDGRGRRVLHG
jgi:hypothetical protein